MPCTYLAHHELETTIKVEEQERKNGKQNLKDIVFMLSAESPTKLCD